MSTMLQAISSLLQGIRKVVKAVSSICLNNQVKRLSMKWTHLMMLLTQRVPFQTVASWNNLLVTFEHLLILLTPWMEQLVN